MNSHSNIRTTRVAKAIKAPKSLTELKERVLCQIIRFTDDEISCRLMAMGVLPGTKAEILRKAPLNGGFYIKFDNQRVALRKDEAASIMVVGI